jgi:kumamolisin
LKAFWKLNKVNQDATRYTTINVLDVDLPPINTEQPEETLDAEWTSSIAPDAKIRLYATGTLQFVDLNQGLQRILDDAQTDPSLRVLSISLGANELGLGDLGPGGVLVPADIIAAEEDLHLKLAALGVNTFVSSGDNGAFPSGPQAQVEFAASSPFVIAVGGTRLFLKGDGSVKDEFGWPGSGGGVSLAFDRPNWQKAKGLTDGPMRTVPDVSLVAADDTAARIVVNGVESGVFGTSWSAPTWAGICALLNEACEKAGKPRLAFLPPQLYPLQSKCFRDITKGSNGLSAAPGYDEVTGLGVPIASELMKELTK